MLVGWGMISKHWEKSVNYQDFANKLKQNLV